MELKDIKGIGEQAQRKLNSLNIYTVNDLLEHYPYRYNFINIVNIHDVKDNENCMIIAKVIESGKVQYIKRNFNRLTFNATSDNVILNVTIFNRAFLKPNLKVGQDILLIGKYDKLKNKFIASDIKFNNLENKIESVYHLVDGLTNNSLIKMIDNALKSNEYIDYIPKYYSDKYHE